MRYLLFYEDGPDESRPFGDTGWWIKKFCGWFGVHPVALTPKYTIEHAVEDEQFDGHAWVWLDLQAEHYLTSFTVPRENVVFCVGHDLTGFDGFEGEGQRVKLLSMHPDGVDEEYHSAICATLLLHEVYG